MPINQFLFKFAEKKVYFDKIIDSSATNLSLTDRNSGCEKLLLHSNKSLRRFVVKQHLAAVLEARYIELVY